MILTTNTEKLADFVSQSLPASGGFNQKCVVYARDLLQQGPEGIKDAKALKFGAIFLVYAARIGTVDGRINQEVASQLIEKALEATAILWRKNPAEAIVAIIAIAEDLSGLAKNASSPFAVAGADDLAGLTLP